MSDPEASAAPLRECKFCGLFQALPPLARGTSAHCRRCGATLRAHRTDPEGRALALATAGMMLFLLAATEPFLDLSIRGQQSATTLVTGPIALSGQGLWEVSLVVLGTTVAAPLAKLGAVLWVLVGLRLGVPAERLRPVFRWVERLTPWSMVEVFLLGVFVAYVKLAGLASVHVGLAVYALGGLMLTMAATDAVLDHQAIWRRLEPAGLQPLCAAGDGAWIGCDCCGQVSRQSRAIRRLECPRCQAPLQHRKRASLGRCAALLLAAALLYIPANTLPVLTAIQLGRGHPDTILAGVQELAAAGQWPLAALVFIASITVPVLKLVGLAFLLISTQRRRPEHLLERGWLYQVVEAVGRWSMIDVFMISILTALVHAGALATITPGPGVLCFCAVVILTMLAAQSFDPRLMWDLARRNDGIVAR